MKKLSSIVLLVALLLCMLGSCTYNEPIVEVNDEGYVVIDGVVTGIVAEKDDVISVDDDGYVVVNGLKTEYSVTPIVYDKINYPLLSSDVKIESLALVQQQKIDEYVADCKLIYTATYAQLYETWNVDFLGEPYLSFTDTFVYDFSKVDENDPDAHTSFMWNEIKALNNGETAPIMYVELSGFCNYYGDAYKPSSFAETSFIYGYFIFENETVMPYLYSTICKKNYIYELPKATQLINCGDKYSEEKRMDALVDLFSEIQQAIQAGASPSDLLKRLTLVSD